MFVAADLHLCDGNSKVHCRNVPMFLRDGIKKTLKSPKSLFLFEFLHKNTRDDPCYAHVQIFKKVGSKM